MKTVLFLGLLALPGASMAQFSHWRYALTIGPVKPFSQLDTEEPIPKDRLTIRSSSSFRVQAALERSISNLLSIKATVGTMPLVYSYNSSYKIRDTSGQQVARISGGSRSVGTNLTIGTLGLTLNSKAYGRTIFTAGLDGVVRINGDPDVSGREIGGYNSGQYTIQGQTYKYETIYRFRTQRIQPITLGVAARVGIDHRISKRGMLTLDVIYTKGFGYVRKAIASDLQIDGRASEGSYLSRASNVSVQFGYKHSLFRVNPLSSFQFTPYNQPQLAPPRFLTPEQRAQTFRAGTWQYEVRGRYRALTGLNVLGVGANANYFFANRYALGLALDYQSYYDGATPSADGQLIQVGPVFRTYAGRGRVAPYLEAGYQVGWFVSPYSASRFLGSVPITAGFSIRVSEPVRLNLSYSLRYYKRGPQTGTEPALPQVSVSFSPKSTK